MSQQQQIIQVKQRLIDGGFIKSGPFAQMDNSFAEVKAGIAKIFPITGSALYSFWLGEYPDPDHGFTEHGLRANYHNRGHVVTALQRLFNPGLETLWYMDKTYPKRAAVLALMLHDVYHTHGRMSDSGNIGLVLPLFSRRCAGDYYPVLRNAGVTEEHFISDIGVYDQAGLDAFMGVCRDLVIDTMYPYRVTPSPLGGVLRDIDRLAIVSPSYFEEVFEGLYNEITKNNAMLFTQFCKNQLAFMKNFEWFSEEVKKAFEPSMTRGEMLTG